MALAVAIAFPGVSSRGDEGLFRSAAEREAFQAHVAILDRDYNPEERLLRRPFSSPGYHTTLTGGMVHPTRDSARYAVALLDTGDPERLERASDVLRRLLALQDQNSDSRTYGIWSWFMEEPLEQMAPPDWNWANFIGVQLLQVALDHWDRLPEDLRLGVRDGIEHACRSIMRRNVGPGYTNIALMGAYVTLVAGERFEVEDFFCYGKEKLRLFYDYTMERGSFSEYNSPTYTRVAIDEISRMALHVQDPESREVIEALNHFAWRHLARRFHPPTAQLGGPHSRGYGTLLAESLLRHIEVASEGRLSLTAGEPATFQPELLRLRPRLPDGLFSFFTTLTEPRQEIETFLRNEGDLPDIIGTTWLHPDVSLGSVNCGDLWNQRRPLVAYWNTAEGPAALRIRALHDGYDYASASLFTVQDRGELLGTVVFVTDRGDTHISLDRISGSITATDLRLRLELEGAVNSITLPEPVALHSSVVLALGPVTARLAVPLARFDGRDLRVETWAEGRRRGIDLILYSGPETLLDFTDMDEAAVAFALSLGIGDGSAADDPFAGLAVQTDQGRLAITWARPNQDDMTLSAPMAPMAHRDQMRAVRAALGDRNPWKEEARSARTPAETMPGSGVIVRQGSRIVFDGQNTRTETYWDGKLADIFTSCARGAWQAYPDVGRVVVYPPPEPNHWVPYPQHWRRMLESVDHNRTRVGEEEHLGLTCWRYEWVQTNYSSVHPPPADVEVPTVKAQALILADDSFPLLMRVGSDGVWDSKSDVLELTVNAPVPAGVFEPPAELKRTKAFRVPPEPFELLLQRTIGSPQHGWSSVATTLVVSDGKSVKTTETYVHQDERGQAVRGPTEQIRPLGEAHLVLNHPLAPPLVSVWRGMRKTGVDECLGFEADILESVTTGYRYWVIDHPDFGAFSARWIAPGDRPQTNEVLRIQVGAP
jgi:hypothetical protein